LKVEDVVVVDVGPLYQVTQVKPAHTGTETKIVFDDKSDVIEIKFSLRQQY
jgi:hypothetical protein